MFLSKSSQDSPTALNAKTPIIALARERIYKKYGSVVKTGARILESADNSMFHVLRIHCKKLRYLMEFFYSLFPMEKMDILIEQLKKLQDNLGDFNDLRVQEEYLLSIARELPVTNVKSKKTLLAIGSLVENLGRDRQMIREAFAKTFADFASSLNRELFQDVFVSQASWSDE